MPAAHLGKLSWCESKIKSNIGHLQGLVKPSSPAITAKFTVYPNASPQYIQANNPRRRRSAGLSDWAELAVEEMGLAALEESRAAHLSPIQEIGEGLTPQEGPDRRPVHEEVLNGFRAELVGIALSQLSR